MKTNIGNLAIELDGEGKGVTIAEIKRITKAFKGLFGVAPRIRISGRFGANAIDQSSPGDQNVDVWDLRSGSGSGYYPVLSVGPRFVSVQPFSGLNNNRSIRLDPSLGTVVRLRFLLPED